ncbi:MAG TPA: hypothetical protein VD833_06030 [Vicinamibacterales bacterium]|nr:hypothetical protein [Vicinamibacterales bacterium]
MLTRTFTGVALAMVAAGSLAVAQVSATLRLRSGENISGDLVDMNGSNFTVRVSGQERQIGIGEVSVIDFGGGAPSASDWNRVTDGQHAVWLRNGEVFSGRLYDISGSTPKRLAFKTASGEREVTSNDVSRIAMVRPSSTPTGTASTSGDGQNITVQATQPWTATGIMLRRGEWVTVKATGEIRLSSDPNDIATPSGVLKQRFDRGAPLPSVLTGALIGRIGNGKPFGIGADNRFQADPGQLYLGINDSNHADNQGSFQVDLQRSSAPVRR